MLTFSILLQLVTLFTCITASSFHHYDQILARRQTTVSTITSVPGFNISMPIDHFNKSDTRVYNNQYWVNDTWYRPGGPVFFFDAGEQGVSPNILNLYLANDNSTVVALARKYGGLVICWEHRYFGGSLPFPLNTKGATIAARNEPIGAPASYQYLTFEQSLEDIVYFANNLARGGYQANDLSTFHPSKTPWIFVGGSYPGIRAAVMRIRNPEIIYAAWSSSAPVEAIDSGASYFSPAARSLPSNCSTDVSAIVQHITDVLAGPKTAQEYKDLQNLTYISSLAPYQGFKRPFNYTLAQGYDPFSIAAYAKSFLGSGYFQSYGPTLVSHPFCNFFESYNPSVAGIYPNNTITSILSNPGTAPPSAKGFLASNGNNLTLGMYAYFYAQVRNVVHLNFEIFNYTISSASLQPELNSFHSTGLIADDIDLVDFRNNYVEPAVNVLADSAAWYYLVNTQFGWFQAYDGSYSTPGNSLVSRFYNVTSDKANGRRVTFDNVTVQFLPNQADVNAFNRYGGWNMTPSNVMFTDGTADPWRSGSVFSEETELGGPNRPVTTVIPACGKAPQGNTVYGALYNGAAHVWDLRALSFIGKQGAGLSQDGKTPQQIGMDLFTKALDVWLPCFMGK